GEAIASQQETLQKLDRVRETLRQLTDRIQELVRMRCTICANALNCALGCGHATCDMCLARLPDPKSCPVCRAAITSVKTIYISSIAHPRPQRDGAGRSRGPAGRTDTRGRWTPMRAPIDLPVLDTQRPRGGHEPYGTCTLRSPRMRWPNGNS